MPNPPRVDLVKKAICSGTFGLITFRESASRRLRDNPDLQNYTQAGIRGILRKFVCMKNDAIDPRAEDPEINRDPENPYWYRVVIPVQEFAEGLFLKIKITDYDEDEPEVQIVNLHRQSS